MHQALEARVEKAWNDHQTCIPKDLSCVKEVLEKLNLGGLRVANKIDGVWVVNGFVKKAILMYMKHTKAEVFQGDSCNYFDKIPLKTQNWTEKDFANAGFRMVYGSVIRYAAFIAKSVVVMPSFINIGAYIDEGTMVDTNSLVGSCAQIGKYCHISDGVTVGGVLEPLQANPVIIEDNCFIGVRSSVTEGVIVEEGSVLGAGTCLTTSTKIINRNTGDVLFGRIPAYSVVVPGTYQSGNINLNCAVIVKQVDEKTRKKTSINELLRD